MLVLNFGVFFEDNMKIINFVRFTNQFWHLLEKYDNSFFKGVRLQFLHFFSKSLKQKLEIRMC